MVQNSLRQIAGRLSCWVWGWTVAVVLLAATGPARATDSVTVVQTGPVLDEAIPANTRNLKVALTSQPAVGKVVVINLGSDTVNGLTLSTSTLTFTRANWNVQQTVVATVVNDAVVEAPLHASLVTLAIDPVATTFDVYDAVVIPNLTVWIYDNDLPVSVYRTGPALDENNPAATQTMYVRINTQPTAGQVVRIDLGSDTAQGVTLSQANLTFNHANWSTFQTVTITVVNDAVVEAAQHAGDITLTVNAVATTYNAYDSVTIPKQTVWIADNDAPVSVYRTGPAMDESNPAATQTLYVRINTQPTAGQVVRIDLGSDTAQGVTLSQSNLTFTNANWNIFQTATITVVDDTVVEAPQHSTDITLTVNAVATTFNSYDSVTIPNQTLWIADNDAPVSVYRTGPGLDEGNPAATQTMYVRVNTQPPAGQVVRIDLGSDTVTGVTLSASSLIFTNTNWSTFQTVTITVVNDAVAEAPQQGSDINLTINPVFTTFDAFDGVTIPKQTVWIADNDSAVGVYRVGPSLDENNPAATQTMYVRINAQPTAGQVVKIDLGSDTAKGVTLAQSSLTFTNSNWNVYQSVIITVVNDAVVEAAVHTTAVTLTIDAVGTTFNSYDSVTIPNQTLAIYDNDAPVSVYRIGLLLNEDTPAVTQTMYVRINTQPTAGQVVVIDLSSNTAVGVTLSKSSLTFTNANWNVFQTVLVAPVDDTVVEAALHSASVSLTVNAAATTFNAYDSVTIPSETVWIADNDHSLNVDQSSLVFTTSLAAGNPASQSFHITRTGNGTAQWTIQSDAAWLSTDMAMGDTTGETDLVTVSVNKAGLDAGTYSGHLTVTDPVASNSPRTVNVSFTITTSPTQFVLSTNTVAYTTAQDDAAPVVTVANGGTGTLTWTATSSQTWLVPSPASGATVYGSPAAVTLKLYFSLLAPGTYTGTVTFTAAGASNSPQVVNVTLTVTPYNQFETAGSYLRTVYVNPLGNDGTADGSAGLPYRTLRAACAQAVPGDIIQLSAGSFEGWTGGTPLPLSGTYAHPIKIQGDSAGGTTIACSDNESGQAVNLLSPAFLTIQDLNVTGFSNRAIRIDGATYVAANAHHLVVRRCKFSASTVNATHAIRFNRTDLSVIDGCDITMPVANAANDPIGLVASFHITVKNCYIHDCVRNAVRLSTQCEDVLMIGNKLENILNAGLYLDGFRNAAVANLMINTFAPLRFEASEECLGANNTIYRARQYCLWFSQPGGDPFVSKNGRVINNIFVFNNSELTTYCNNGVNSFPATYQYKNNAWYSLNVPGFAGPTNTAATEINPLFQVNPQFISLANANYRLASGSALRGNGLLLTEVPKDADGNNYNNPPARGAFELALRPTIGLVPSTMTFNSTTGSEPAAPQTSTLSNTGAPGTKMTWTAAPSQPWLAVTPQGGTTGPGGNALLTVSAAPVVAENWSNDIQSAGGLGNRERFGMVWTGSQVLIWGGDAGSGGLGNGGIYTPGTDTWSSTGISSTNAPSARQQHCAVWTGSKMIIWGGDDGHGSVYGDGKIYDPVTNTWANMSSTNAPSARRSISAVWTGTEMIVWGGFKDASLAFPANDGKRYNPSTDTWSAAATSTTNAPSARGYHQAVWTGTEMIVWGGDDGTNVLANGGRYNPSTDTWSGTAIATAGAPAARSSFAATWTGARMIVWGGDLDEPQLTQTNTGAFYDPATNTWTGTTTTVNAPVARHGVSAVWTGTQMVVWGGYRHDTDTFLNDGRRYAPAVTLGAGVYEGLVSIVDPSANNSPQTIAVTLNVTSTGTHLDYGTRPSLVEQAGPAATTHFSYFTVEVRNATGAVVTGDNSTQVTVGKGGATGTLSGTLTKTVVNGVAVFDDLSFDTAGSVTLTLASSPPFPGSATPATIDVQPAFAPNAVLTRVSQAPGGGQMTATTGARGMYLSSDGRYATFVANGTNLVPVTLSKAHQFLYDRVTGKTVALSLTPSGGEPVPNLDTDVNLSGISANGRFVTFTSVGGDLVSGDTNGLRDVFVRDAQRNRTDRVTVNSSGVESNGSSLYSTISTNGRFVAFESAATNLVGSDTNSAGDGFVYDRLLKTCVMATQNTASVQGAGYNHTPYLSGNGRYVTFSSTATNLVAGDTNGVDDVFVRDLVAGVTVRVSTTAGGAEGNGFSQPMGISRDGTWILFWSTATNLVPGDTNGHRDVFLKNLSTGAITLVSVSSTGVQGDADSDGGVYGNGGLSGDGRYCVFLSTASNLDGVDTLGGRDAYVHDLVSGVTRKISGSFAGGEANADVEFTGISESGQYLGFTSAASNVVVDDTNGCSDAFVLANPLAAVTPILQVSTRTMKFAADRGGVPPGHQSLYVRNAGSGTLSWSATANRSWVQVLPAGGSLTTGTGTLDIAVDSTGMAAGYYDAAITVTGAGAENSPYVVEVRLAVLPVSDIGLTPNNLAFNAQQGGANPAAQTVTLANVGNYGSQMDWSVGPTQPWLQVAPGSGQLFSGSTPLTVTAQVSGGDVWGPTISTTNAPSVREAHSAVWTGTEMIIWGGWADAVIPNGGIYTPATNSWRSISTLSAPIVAKHAAVWTGSKMIVWGGMNAGSGYVNAGYLYDPATDTWSGPISATNAPSARWHPSAVWTGTEMIVWGGQTSGGITNTGARYNPSTNTWSATPTTTSGAPSARVGHTAIWTGTEMIVWGGTVDGTASGLNDGGRYNPATNQWAVQAIPTTGAPSPRSFQSAAWTGDRMVIWGGSADVGTRLNTGARYDPATNTWTGATSLVGVPLIRHAHSAIWTGSQMVIWGGWWGSNGSGHVRFNDGTPYAEPFALLPGVYTDTISISASNAGNSPQTVSVTFTVGTGFHVTAMSPAPGSSVGASPSQITITFDLAADATTVNPQSLLLIGSGGDGTFNDGNEVMIQPDGVSLTSATQATMDLSSVTLPTDTYRVTALADNSSGRAVTLDGVDDCVTIPNSGSLNPTTTLTVEAWVNFTAGGDGNPRIVSKGDLYYELFTVGTGGSRKIGAIFGTQNLTSASTFTAGTWHHAAVTYDAASFCLYVDGVLEGTAASTGALTANSNALVFGHKSGTAANNFKGSIDDVHLWNVARTQAQVRTDMTRNLTGTESGLLGCWRINETSGQSVGDDSVFGNSGTLGATGSSASDDPARSASGAGLVGILNLAGVALDGEYSGTLPSGNGTVGGDFYAGFTKP